MGRLDLTSYPERIRRIESEYRKKSALDIGFAEVDRLPEAGNALGVLSLPNCVARIVIRKGLSSAQRFQAICHEMLHLDLTLKGYPSLQPLSNDHNAKNLAAHLESLLQHRLIMPIEQREFLYDPYVIERNVAESLCRQFIQLTDFGSPTDPLWQFLYSCWAVSYARVTILAVDSTAFRKLSEFFKKPEMKPAIEIARGLHRLIQQSDLTDPRKYTALLHTILDSHIQANVINATKRIQVGDPCFP